MPLVQSFGTHNFRQAVIVSVVHRFAAELNAHERCYNGWATTFNTHTSDERSFDLDLHPHPGMDTALKKVLAFG